MVTTLVQCVTYGKAEDKTGNRFNISISFYKLSLFYYFSAFKSFFTIMRQAPT